MRVTVHRVPPSRPRASSWVAEALESRRLLAGTVTISATPDVVEGGAITVTFNVSDPSVFNGQTTTYAVGCNIAGAATVDLDYAGSAYRE